MVIHTWSKDSFGFSDPREGLLEELHLLRMSELYILAGKTTKGLSDIWTGCL